MQSCDPSDVPADLFPVTFQTAIRHGGVSEWEFALEILKETDPKYVVLKTAAT
jgi:hypothetical protein